MATTERLNSELKRLIDVEQSLFQYQMTLLKQAAQEYELKFDSKSCSVPDDMAYVIYAGGDFVEDATLTEIKPRDVYDCVGYAKILVLNDDLFKELETALGTPFGESLQLEHGYKDYKELTQEQVREWTEQQIDAYGYKEFIEIYDSFDLESHIIYIDGFECQLPDPAYDPDMIYEEIPNGEALSIEYFKEHADEYDGKSG